MFHGWWLYLFLLSSGLGIAAASGTQDLMLVPVPQKERPPLELELRHQENPMGSGPPHLVKDGIVSIDHTEVFAVRLPDGRSPVSVVRAKGNDLYLVRIDFTLHPPEGMARFKEAEIGISLVDPKTAEVDIFPKRLAIPTEVPRSLQVKTDQIQGRSDDMGPIAVAGMEPVVTGFQRRSREAYWILHGPEGDPLRPGSRRVFLLVRAPAGSRALAGAVRCTGKVETWLFNQWWSPVKTESDQMPLEAELLGSVR